MPGLLSGPFSTVDDIGNALQKKLQRVLDHGLGAFLTRGACRGYPQSVPDYHFPKIVSWIFKLRYRSVTKNFPLAHSSITMSDINSATHDGNYQIVHVPFLKVISPSPNSLP